MRVRIGSLSVALILLVTSPALAQGEDGAAEPSADQREEARRLYNDAVAALKGGRYKEAALGFEATSKLRRHAVAFYSAAKAWEQAEQPARAADAYALALEVPRLRSRDEKRARQRLTDLEKILGTVVVTGSAGTRVQIDDHLEVEIPARLHGTSGTHSLAVTRADGSSDTIPLRLKPGTVLELNADDKPKAEKEEKEEKEEVAAPPPAPEPVAPPPPPPPPQRDVLETVGWAVGGAGLAALGTGIFLGISANGAADAYEATPSRETFDHASNLQTRTNVVMITGGVLAAAGAGLVVWRRLGKNASGDPKRDTSRLELRAGPTGLSLEGSF